jgi:exosome complex component RRP42
VKQGIHEMAGADSARGSMLLLSAAERDFVSKGVEQGVRPDGRERLASRSIHLELGVIPGAFGSAQAQCGGTKVVAAVKAELVAPDVQRPGGRIEASVSCTLTASPLFEGQRGEDMAAELTFAMNRMLQGGLPAATRKKLGVSPHHCWLLLVDAVVINYDGAMLDAVSSAVYAALADTRLPNVLVQTGKDGKGEIEMLDDASGEIAIGAGAVPIFVTLAQVHSNGNPRATFARRPGKSESLCSRASAHMLRAHAGS